MQTIISWTYMCVGWPGSVHDARICTRKNSRLIPVKSERINSVDVPLYIIGDSTYPMQH